MSWARRHPILLGAILIPVLLVAGLWTKETLAWRAFYDKHRLVKAIDQHPEGFESEIITKYVPLGTPRTDVIRVMSQEGFHCQRWTDSAGRDLLGCSLLGPASFGRTGRRHIQFAFNPEAELTNARDLRLK